MGNLSGVAGQLKKELVRAQQEVQRFTAALAALGSPGSNGRRTRSASARKRLSLAQKRRCKEGREWQCGYGKTQEHNIGSRQKENRGCCTCPLGEVQSGEEEVGLAAWAARCKLRLAFVLEVTRQIVACVELASL
jgi:hypothetical protein